ncbi:putative zinc finger in N-recognin [Dictyocaulus viviparus]|uniref:E3 ubiquitin-protein ligase n=1 Tax=Dictyocaulus viviparus TaxID=29172 RepID=A0A0D8XVT5_DICVI|nr:putative zinc finger in N-recognin [Dictyocaulus viviparus]
MVPKRESFMPPHPGDPHSSHQSNELNNSGLNEMFDSIEDDNHPFNIILRMNDFNTVDKRCKDAVLYCKSLADFLKLNGYPLYANRSLEKSVSPRIRKVAHQLSRFLDNLITLPSVRLQESFLKLRILLAQGEPYELFKASMHELDVSLKCNAIWENDSVAYRCNTCALTPCMSLCASCFQAANHEGHDFTRFFSREGGACDCGNADVIKPIGFCPRHGENAVRPPSPSPLIVSLPRHIFLKLIVCLFLEWRGFNFKRDRYTQEREAMGWEEPFNLAGFCESLVNPMKHLINFLQECVNYGGPMRQAMAEILMDKELYLALTERNLDDVDSTSISDMSLDWRTRQMFRDDRMSIFSESLLPSFPHIDVEKVLEKASDSVQRYTFYRCECLLDELLLWDCLSTRFFTWYPFVANCVRNLCVYQQLRERNSDVVQSTCSRLIHISVQVMLSSEALCKKLNNKCDLVHVVLNTACYLFNEYLEKTEMTLDPFFVWCTSAKQLEGNQSDWNVMLLERNATMTQHGYWFVMGDLQNLLAHSSLAIDTVLHPTAFSSAYVMLLNRMQGCHVLKYLSLGMNVNWRIVRGEHRENDNADLVQRSFSLEFEALSLTMFNFVNAILQQQNFVAAVAFFDKIISALSLWLHTIGGWTTSDLIICPKYCVSFHLPLHRHLSTALSHFNDMEAFRNHVEDFRKDEQLLRRILLHPLKIQVARAEYHAGMWVRNGNQLRVQAIIYAQPHINTSFQIPDIDLIRYCAANVDPDWFIDVLIHNFHLTDVFRFAAVNKDLKSDDDMDLSSQAKHTCEGTGRSTPDDIADANWDRCAEQIKVILKDLPSEKVDVVMKAFYGGKFRLDANSYTIPSSSEEHSGLDSENLPELAYIFNEDVANIITRMEWVDPMIASALRLISELIVLLTNCGASNETALRSEMVNALASGPYTYSRLRSIIAEKGTRGAEFVDPLFDRVLNDIADFSEPVAVPGGQMRQGSYLLKTEILFSEFCPVLCQNRALYPKSSTGVLMDVEKIEREMLGNEEKIQQMWYPYKLPEFTESVRHKSVQSIANILLCDRFVQLCIVILEAGILGRPEVRETTIQLVVYLITIAYLYMSTLPQTEKYAAVQRFRRSYVATEGLKVVQLPLLVFVLFLIECEKRGVKDKILKKTLTGDFEKKRIIGGAAEYMARLVTYISKCDEGVYLSLLSALDDCEKGKTNEKKSEGNDQKAVQDRKAAAKRRRDALFAANKKKNSEVMKRLMEKEGLTQKDMDSIDTTQPDVRLYECPICGELDTPSTLRNPLGMVVRLTNNGLCDNLVPSDEDEISLLDLDSKNKHVFVPSFIRHWKSARKELTQRTLCYSDIVDLSTSVELKTCGHTVHMKCFNAYRETIRNDLRVGDRRSPRDVSCFLCRFSVNALLPLRIDWGFEAANKEMLTENQTKARVRSSKGLYYKLEKNPTDDYRPYSEHFTENMFELMDSRYWNRWENINSPVFEVQTHLVALIKSVVERSVILKKLKIPERRKGTRSAVTEHLIAACVCRTRRRDEEISLSSCRDLFLPQARQDVSSLINEEDPLTFSDDDLINICDIRKDDSIALQSASARERSRRHSVSEGPATSKTHYLDKPSPVPLMLFGMKSLFVRLSAFVLDNQHLSAEDRKKLCHVLARRMLAALSVKTILRLLMRSSRSTLNSISEGTYPGEDFPAAFTDIPRMVWSRLSSNAVYLDSLLAVMHHDGWQEEKSFGAAFEWVLIDFALFVAEFWQQVGLVKISATDYSHPTLIDALRYIGLDQWSIAPEQSHVYTWTRQFSPFLVWNYDTPRKVS